MNPLRTALRVPRAGARAFGAPASTATPLPDYVLAAPEATGATAGSGLKIGSVNFSGETATVTAWTDAGSRYETPATNGVANLFQTAALEAAKGDIAALGGMVSGYTTREQVVFEAKVLKENVPAATKLLADMMTKVGDVDGAKDIVAANLAGAKEFPEEVILEHLHDAAFLDQSMGMPIQGSPESVASLTADDVAAYMAANVTAARTAVAGAGAVAPSFTLAAEEAFSKLPSLEGDLELAMEPAVFTGSDKRIRIDSMESGCHTAFAFAGASHSSSDAVELLMIQALLGSFDMSSGVIAKNMTSKLAIDQGEQEAAKAFTVVNTSYKDSGLFGVYFQCPDNRAEDAMWYTLWNLVRLCHKTTDAEVDFAQTALKTQILTNLGTNAGVARHLAKSLLFQGRAVSTRELFARVDAVTKEDIKNVAKKIINDQDHALAGVGQIYELPDYNWIRRRSYWIRY